MFSQSAHKKSNIHQKLTENFFKNRRQIWKKQSKNEDYCILLNIKSGAFKKKKKNIMVTISLNGVLWAPLPNMKHYSDATCITPWNV